MLIRYDRVLRVRARLIYENNTTPNAFTHDDNTTGRRRKLFVLLLLILLLLLWSLSYKIKIASSGKNDVRLHNSVCCLETLLYDCYFDRKKKKKCSEISNELPISFYLNV